MVTDPEAAAIGGITFVGATAIAVTTLREYEPPPPDGEDEAPKPVFEAGLFFVVTSVLFALLGLVLATVGRMAPPVGPTVTLLLSLVGLYSAYGTYTGRIHTRSDRAGRRLGVVSATVLGVYPPVFFVLSHL